MSVRHKLIVPLLLLAITSSVVIINIIAARENNTIFLPMLIRVTAPDRVRFVPYGDRGFQCTVTDIANAGDGRLFVVQQNGRIDIIDDTGHVLDEPFIDLTWVSDPCYEEGNWEMGLLGIAFHPNHAQNGHFYVVYNDPETYAIRLARYTVSDDDPNIADPTSKEIMLTIAKSPDPFVTNVNRSQVHNGGDLNFGPDGYLYVGFGDGGTDPDRVGNALINKPIDPIPGDLDNDSQNLNNLLGTIIRIDVDSTNSINPDCGETGYSIPSDNPFVNASGGTCGEIWSYGWRNPWRFSFDPFTGDMYVGDVGEWERDEISVDEASSGGGGNFGWNCYEGDFDHSQAEHVVEHCNGVPTIPPLYAYKGAWPGETAMSVNGGFVYRGRDVTGLRGYYVFGDFLDGRNLWRLRKDRINEGMTRMEIVNKHELPGQFAQSRTLSWTTFGEDVNGELYVGEWYGFANNTTGTYIYKVENE